MRTRIGVLVLLLAAAPATAGLTYDPLLDQKLNLGNFTLAGAQSIDVFHTILPNNNPVVGFSISFDYNDAADSFAWASDLRVVISPPLGGPVYSVGGYSTPSDSQYTWFTNTDTNTGFYNSGPHSAWDPAGVSKGGVWLFNLTNNFAANGGVQWNNVSVTLHKVPEPTSLGLLALGSLALLRRRR